MMSKQALTIAHALSKSLGLPVVFAKLNWSQGGAAKIP
jgi:adenine/guanine phosphoribosyltransferase-like PRPP-binding protein|tara:strand:+ start:6827 stop:6940 length:114 start_codon:yes stop_codon:yes gene_type:complete